MKAAFQKRFLVLTLSGLLFGGLIAGCGVSEEPAPATTPDYAKDLAGSPSQLAALHEEGGELLDGGLDAYEQRLAALKGYPVVVNVWASWCAPCRSEFPLIQRAAADQGKQVAFLGVNSQDSDEFAAEFLADYPVPFPSYIDPDKSIAREVGATHGLPATVFYGSDGELNQVKHGEFADQEELDQYIRQYAVKG